MKSLFFSVVILLCFANSKTANAQPKNILYLRFDTAHFAANRGVVDTVLSVKYRLQCPKPCKFHAFGVKFAYDRLTIVPNEGVFEGSALENTTHFASNGGGSGFFSVAALAQINQTIDTSNHLLFRYRSSIKPSDVYDSAIIGVFDIDTSAFGGIDTVIVENASGKDEAGWFPFAVAYFDPVEVVPKKYEISVKTDSVSIRSDSIGTVHVSLLNIDSAHIASASFTAFIDTSRIEIKQVHAGIDNSLVAMSVDGNMLHLAVDLTTTSAVSGPVWNLDVLAKHRNDTSCAIFSLPHLAIANADNRVQSIEYEMDSICILGDPLVDTLHAIVLYDKEKQANDCFVVNEGDVIRIHCPLNAQVGAKKIRIYSVMGALVYTGYIDDSSESDPISLPRGMFFLLIEDTLGLIRMKKIVIIR